ncbi:MAG: hypothetical protein ACQEWU_18525 [Bacillota bacterium]|uniref:Uncharacterized protein n=1 Tax=Virgibacillus salarius TaxID=447199 RepID=A0A941IAQ6_9BACI|nr:MULTISPECIES: hypothetical protein [Bacillaceae]NAZ08314.1 hypothetical protein [Agaribacter marinus]MBR7795601.1 hypothetical protein [Virgibacillus salarius]MCC2252646.1 hypothetical protein [Virgibacillus sp. AGTR]MDY7046648.1 hypothetical protein [Virgibacillus sp. M23]QRZ18567.1 hypothetical protein JUJ52_02090 [Virgibacillus sp. AGTR]
MDIFITIVLIIAIFASIAAWINTQTILKELKEIKEHLGLKGEQNVTPPFIKNDLDK